MQPKYQILNQNSEDFLRSLEGEIIVWEVEPSLNHLQPHYDLNQIAAGHQIPTSKLTVVEVEEG